MINTKIDWVSDTVNPVIGCPNGCGYCYAKRLNDRFKFVKDFAEPEYFPERLNALKAKKGRDIFIGSMSDCGTWKKEWWNETTDTMKANPQHDYLFLTKKPELLLDKIKDVGLQDAPNVFIGETITKGNYKDKGMDFVSIEPLHGKVSISITETDTRLCVVIIGAETGKRKDRIVPKKEWVDDIVSQCKKYRIRVFMKESLREIMGADFRQDKLSWQIGD